MGSDTGQRHMGVRAVSKNNQIDSPTPIGLVRKDKRNLPSYLILRTPIYTEVGVVSELYRYRLSRPPDDLNILRWVLIRSAVTVLRYIGPGWHKLTQYVRQCKGPTP